tara:strand:+ start:1120 stop:1377 length:258 start_codon:yes stop_codon:yes gene_type:complete
MDKKSLSERAICTKLITPAIENAGWIIKKQVREEVFFTDGRVVVQGSLHTRGQRKITDVEAIFALSHYFISISRNNYGRSSWRIS